MKKILSLILIVVLTMTMGSVFASTLPDRNSDVSFLLADEIVTSLDNITQNDPRIAKQDTLLQFYSDFITQIDKQYLGGSYFDENGDLNIILKEEMYYSSKKLLQEGVSYKIGKYSYTELEEFQDIANENRIDIGLVGTGIDQEENKIMIYTNSNDNLNTDLLFALIPSDAIKISIGENEGIDTATHTVSPGSKISNTTNNTYGSISCGVVWDNSTSNKKYGFMTAGHLGSVGDSLSYSGSSMGTLTKKQQSGSVDAALILNGQTSHTFNYSNKVPDGKSFTYNGGIWPKNTEIYAYGATTTSTISGKITDTSYSNTFSGIYFTKLIRTDATNQRGDSGGPVITSYSGSYAIIGIMKGYVGSDMVYVNMQEIKDAFDLNALNN